MYSQIKEMAEEALKLQNKDFMDEAFKRIIAICDGSPARFNPEKIVLEDLIAGRTVLVDGAYVKLAAGDPPVNVAEAERQLRDSELLAGAPGGFSAKAAEKTHCGDPIAIVDGAAKKAELCAQDAVTDDDREIAADISAAMCERFQETVENSKIVVTAKALKAKKGGAK